MSPDQVEELGTALARCRQNGTVSPLRLERIASVEDAQAVQAAAVEAYGGVPRGYAIRATTALSRRLLCCDEPFFGLEVLHVQGPFIGRWDSLDLASKGGSVRFNGELVANGCFRDFLGHPLEAIAWLARLLKARDQELDAGDIVSTGTCTGLLQVVSGQTFEAEFGGLGSVKVSFE